MNPNVVISRKKSGKRTLAGREGKRRE